jgi:hypothetical protein
MTGLYSQRRRARKPLVPLYAPPVEPETAQPEPDEVKEPSKEEKESPKEESKTGENPDASKAIEGFGSYAEPPTEKPIVSEPPKPTKPKQVKNVSK